MPNPKKKSTKAKKPSVPAKQTGKALTPAQEDKVIQDAVAYISQQTEHAATSMLEIGRYLLERFFDDDPDKVRQRSRGKKVSLHKLAEHPDIPLSFSSLQRAVDLAINEVKYFSDPTLGQLSNSHKLLLIRLAEDDPKLVKKYGEKTVSDELSVRRLRDLLVEDGRLAKRGRGALDDDQRALSSYGLSQITRPIDQLLALTLDKFDEKLAKDPENVPKEAIDGTIAKLKQAKQTVDKLIGELEKRR